MRNNPSILIIEINKNDFIFICGKSDENFNFELIQEVKVPLNGIEKNHLLSVSVSIERLKKYFSDKTKEVK